MSRYKSTIGDSIQYLNQEIEAIQAHLATLNDKYETHIRRYVEYSKKLCAAKSLLDGNLQFPFADSVMTEVCCKLFLEAIYSTAEDIETYETKLAVWRVKRLDTLKSMAAYDYNIEAFKEKS